MSAEQKFAAIRARYLTAAERERAYRLGRLYAKYRQSSPPRSWMTNGEIQKLETLRRAQDREVEKMFALLDSISPRDWRSTVPCN